MSGIAGILALGGSCASREIRKPVGRMKEELRTELDSQRRALNIDRAASS